MMLGHRDGQPRPIRVRRIAAGLAGLAMGMSLLSAAGLAAAAPDRLAMDRANGASEATVKTTAALRTLALEGPPPPGAPSPVCAPAPAPAAEPAAAEPAAGAPRFSLTRAQLLINQRIAQAAIRRLNAVQERLDGGLSAGDLCGFAIGAEDLDPAIATAVAPAALAPRQAAAPEPVRSAPRRARSATGTVRLTAAQLLINQRIGQAAVRRANGLAARLAEGLTGGDIRDGQLSQAKLAERLRVVAAPATPAPAPSRTVVPPRQAPANPGAVGLTPAQLRINQRVYQAAVRRANALVARLEAGITGAEIRDGSLTAADLAGGVGKPVVGAGAPAPGTPAAPGWDPASAPPLPAPVDVGLTTRTRVATGAMLGEGGNPRWLYVSESVGPWRPTYDDGHPLARGKLMNFRAINAIYDDENKDQLIPGFDPEANTDEFIRWLPTYRELGILGFTLGLQGGKPNYEGNLASAFNPDGSLKQAWLDRAERVIRAADEQGMVVILSYFYKVQERLLDGDEAIRRGAREATDWVIARGFGNVIIEIANEYNTSGYKHPILTAGKEEATFPGVVELISLVKSRFEGRGYRLPVGASHTRLEVPPPIRAVADLSLVHGNPYRPAEDGALVADLVNDPTVPGPVIVNEDFNGYGTGEANIQGERQSASNVFLAGGSWGHMWQPYNQAYPFHWAVGESEDVSGGDEANRFRAVLNHVAHLVAPDGAPPSFGEVLPADGATDVSTSTSIVVGFSEPMAPSSMASGSLVLSRDGVPVPASVGLAPSGDLVTLTPDAPLEPNALHAVTLTPGATDTAGNPLTGGTSWTFTTGPAPAPGLGPAIGQAGQVTLEAEAASASIARGAHAWLAGHSPSGSIGGALVAGPESGTTIFNNPRQNAAELRFDVRFPQPGTYRVWLRGYSPDGDANSVSLSLDGQDPNGGDASNMTTLELGAWRWFTTRNGGPVSTLSVPTAGQHTVHVYMREDGFHLDRLWLSNAPPNSASEFPVPDGIGPPASPRA